MKAKRVLLMTIALTGLSLFLATAQTVPQLINYQGRLTNAAGIPLDGVSVDLTFTFYPTEFGSTPFLIIAQPSVLVTKGIYNFLIGSGGILPGGSEDTLAEVFQNNAEVWMGVQVNTDPEMTPRARIASAAFALKAEKCDKVDTKWLTAFTASNDFDQDGYSKNIDCDDGDPALGPPSIWQKFGSDCRVTNDASNSQDPSLSWTGTEFGVSWHDGRDGNAEIYFARVSTAGAKIGSDLRVTNNPGSSSLPKLSWTGSEFGVSWQDNRDGNNEIYFARLSAAGVKLGSDLRVTNDASNSSHPSLSWTGSEFGVSWYDERDGNVEIYFVRVSSAGAKIGLDLRVTNDANYSYYPSLSWTGSEFGVSWQDYRDANWEIYFARISSAGVKIGEDLRVTNDAGDSSWPSLSWTGSEFGVSWQDNYIKFARVSSSGAEIGSKLQVNSGYQPSLSWTGSEFAVSWYDNHDGNWEIYFARVSSAGAKIGSDLRVTDDASSSYIPSLSWTGSEFGVSWYDDRYVNIEIYFARIGGVCP